MKLLCVVLALSVTGCSFLFTRGPSDGPPRSYPSCSSSMAWPIVDGVFSALFLVSMSTAIASDDDEMDATVNEDDNATRAQKITSAALLAAATGISAYVGYRRVSRCRRAQESFQMQYPNGGAYQYGPQQQYPTYPQTYPAQPQPYPGQQPQQYPPAQSYPPAQTYPPAQPAPTTQPTPLPAPTALGTEGDVCASSAECSTGLTCASNVCVRPPSKQ